MSLQRVQSRADATHRVDQPQHQGREIFIGTDVAGQMLSKSRAAFRMWAKRRRLTVIKNGSRWLVSELDIKAELKRREQRA